MLNIEKLLSDLEAKRDIAYMDAKEARVKADTLDYVIIRIRTEITRNEQKGGEL